MDSKIDQKVLLTKCITLLYKESLLKVSDNGSRETIRELLKRTQPREIGINLGTDKDIVVGLRKTVQDMLTTPIELGFDRTDLLQRIRINVLDDEKLYQAVEKGVIEKQTEAELRKSINLVRRSLDKYFQEQQVDEVLNSATSVWNYHRDKIPDTRVFLQNLWSKLEPISKAKAKENPAIIDEVRLSDPDQLRKLVSNIHISIVENRFYKTGWQGINRMMQGGIRRGEQWMQAGLQHSYKTGFTQTIMNQVALYNKPFTNEPGRQPAIVMYAFEDQMSERFQFIFKQLMYTETRKNVEIGEISTELMRNIILTKLQVNGFELLFFQINPSMWSVQSQFNHIQDLESSGYSIEFIAFDRLEMIPTIGCNQSGPMGMDIYDMYTRIRVFLMAKGIANFTSHQLSSEATKLIRGTVSDSNFVQALEGKNYYKGSTQLGQVPDGILLTHKFAVGNRTFLAIQRDRHRLTSIVDPKHKHMYLEFPQGMPIPDDLTGEDSTLYKLPRYVGNANEELFQLG